MTAEIVLLNKSAVAMAADSAATLSADEKQQKVFNSEDKLFELSNSQPIGIMIFNSTTFLETPIHILIKKYRSKNRHFQTVDEAATDFRNYLCAFGKSLDPSVRERAFARLMQYPLRQVQKRFVKLMSAQIPFPKEILTQMEGSSSDSADKSDKKSFDELFEECLLFYTDLYKDTKDAQFSDGQKKPGVSVKFDEEKYAQAAAPGMTAKHIEMMAELVNTFLRSAATSGQSTGFVIAGFAEMELFPSLRSFEVDGMAGDHLRFMNVDAQDITLGGASARIVPFAQQEMVDRFVCGLDDISQEKIEKFCRDRLFALHAELLDILATDDQKTKDYLKQILEKADETFMEGLRDDGFKLLKDQAREEMEGMVEFMPKVELAQMAESLVELTSIKRRVSKGFETVGGPIDVAIISRSDGFVWIKRKHYFPPELNTRFFGRVAASVARGERDGDDKQNSTSGAASRSSTDGSGRKTRGEDAKRKRHVTKQKSSPRPVPKSKKGRGETDP